MMAEAKRKLDEQQLKNNWDAQKREKKEFNEAKAAMMEQLRRDKEERFGKGGAGAGPAGSAAPVKKDPPIEVVRKGIKTIQTLYTEDRQPGVAKTCFKTLAVYMKNVLKVPAEEKFQKINLGNEAFQKRVGKISGGLMILKGIGFEEVDGVLVMGKIDESVIKEAIRLVENHV